MTDLEFDAECLRRLIKANGKLFEAEADLMRAQTERVITEKKIRVLKQALEDIAILERMEAEIATYKDTEPLPPASASHLTGRSEA